MMPITDILCPASILYKGYIIQPSPLGYIVFERKDTRFATGIVCKSLEKAVELIEKES